MYTEQINALLKTEAELRGQLAMYGDKFEQFQDTLTKSNEVFATFKKEMEKMSKTIKKLEKENAGLRDKGQKSDLAVVDLAEEVSAAFCSFLVPVSFCAFPPITSASLACLSINALTLPLLRFF